LLHVLKGPARTPQVEEEVGDDLVQHPNVLLGEVEVAERLGVRGEQAPESPRGAARTPAVWDLSSSPVGCALSQPQMACEGVTLTVRPATATEGVRGRDAHRPAHVVVGRSLTLLSLCCVVPTGAGRSFGAGGASRTGRAAPCEVRGRPGYGGRAVVPASGTAACASEVAAGPEMGTAFGHRRRGWGRICCSRVHRNLQ